jgi:septal ring factor EnvC (AmiA/AmiB activator)
MTMVPRDRVETSTRARRPDRPAETRLSVCLTVTVPVVVFLFGLAGPLWGQQIAHPDLDRVRDEIRSLKSSLDSVRAREASAERDLRAIELELEIFSREVDLAQDTEADLQQQQFATYQRIDSLTKTLAEQKVLLARRVGALYKLGKMSYVRLFLSIEDQTNPFEAITMLSYLASRDAREIERFKQTQREYQDEIAMLDDQKGKIAEIRAYVEGRQAQITVKRHEQEKLLASIRAEQRRSESRLAELQEKERRLERLLTLLSERRGSTEVFVSRITEFKGAIQWPASGKVIEGFGRQRSQKFATYTVNNGIKIEAEAGHPVSAVFAGTVLYAQWFKGYGNLVIVDHGERVYSLYGNTQSPRVSVGNKVKPGQVITSVAEDEEGSGYLYFEIREDNKPADPTAWLR